MINFVSSDPKLVLVIPAASVNAAPNPIKDWNVSFRLIVIVTLWFQSTDSILWSTFKVEVLNRAPSLLLSITWTMFGFRSSSLIGSMWSQWVTLHTHTMFPSPYRRGKQDDGLPSSLSPRTKLLTEPSSQFRRWEKKKRKKWNKKIHYSNSGVKLRMENYPEIWEEGSVQLWWDKHFLLTPFSVDFVALTPYPKRGREREEIELRTSGWVMSFWIKESSLWLKKCITKISPPFNESSFLCSPDLWERYCSIFLWWWTSWYDCSEVTRRREKLIAYSSLPMKKIPSVSSSRFPFLSLRETLFLFLSVNLPNILQEIQHIYFKSHMKKSP